MPSIEDMKGALLKAHKAGDTEAAQLFASKIKEANLAPPKEYSGMETIKNIPGSALQYAKDITAPIHSYDTFFPGMKNLAMGVGEKLVPGKQEHEQYADAAGQYYADRYGKDEYPKQGIDNFSDYMNWRNKRKVQTFQKDPIGALSDLSLVGSLSTAPMKATKAGNIANKTAIALDPVNIAVNTGKTAVKALTPKNLASKMYESSAKFSTTIPKKKRDLMVQTALDEGIAPSGKGVAKLGNALDSIDNSIELLIREATESGGKVPTKSVFNNLSKLRKKLGSAAETDGLGNVRKIDEVAKRIGETQKARGQAFYSVEELQRLKRNLYKSANMDVKQSQADDAINQARKNIANKSKTMIEEKIPQIKDINERYGRLIDLQDPLTRSANRIDNRNYLSINQPLNTGAGYAVGSSVGMGPEVAATSSALTALGNPRIKPQLAIHLNKLKQAGLLDVWLENKVLPYAIRQGLLETEQLTDQERR